MQKSITICLFLLVLFSLTFLPRILFLSGHWASDETLWLLRSRDFFEAMKTGQFANTYITHHPGVTTCWLGSIGIWEKYQRQEASKDWYSFPSKYLSPEMLSRIRFPISVMTGILIFAAGYLIFRLFGGKVAGVATLFLGIEPFLLAESRRAHTDALMSLFLFLSLLLWLCYLEPETRRHRYILLSGICFGLACLTKSLAGAFLLFLPFLLWWYVKHRNTPWQELVWGTLLWVSVTLGTVILAWPYFWTATFKLWNIPMFPILLSGCGILLMYSYRKLSMDSPPAPKRAEWFALGYGLLMLLGGILSAIEPVIAEMYWAGRKANAVPTVFLGEIRYNPGILYFPVMWFVWSTPLTFPLIGWVVYNTWRQRNAEKKVFRLLTVLSIFVLFYLLGLSFTAKKISRYIIIFLPVVSLLTALGAVQVVALIRQKPLRTICLIALIVLQIAPILRLHPYYRTYYHPLLSAQWVSENTPSITGAGLDLAADYLNGLPNASDLPILLHQFTADMYHYLRTDTYLDPFKEKSQTSYYYDVEHLYDKQIHGTPVDSPPSAQIQQPLWKTPENTTRELQHVVRLNGIDYVRIYRVLAKETD